MGKSGHSKSDIVPYGRRLNILITGDPVFSGCYPELAAGHPVTKVTGEIF